MIAAHLVNAPLHMNTIVVPTDCSDLSRRALRYADRFASVSGATIVAVYGATFSARLEGEGIAASLASREDLQSMMMPARRCVEEAAAQELSPETKHRIVIADCLPADAVIDVANARNADLIVMGTRDRTRLTRIGTQHRRFSDPSVIGTPASIVVRMAKCPVLSVTASASAA